MHICMRVYTNLSGCLYVVNILEWVIYIYNKGCVMYNYPIG